MLDLDSLRRANDRAADREMLACARPFARGYLAAMEDARTVVGANPALDALIERAREKYRDAHSR